MTLTRVAVVISTVLISFSLPAPAATAWTAPAGRDDDSPSAVAWLERAAQAPDRVSFHARQLVTSWGPNGASSALLDVIHVAQQGSQVSAVGSGGSEGATAFVQRNTSHGPSVDGGPLALLKATYELLFVGTTRTLSRKAVVIEARREDGTRAARFWIDQGTGLLLRRQLYTVDGSQLVRSTVFTALRVGPDTEFIGHLAPMLPDSGDDPVGTGEAGAIRAEGWNCADQLPNSLQLYDVHRDSSGNSLQFSYSDGLFNVSVFEQRGKLDAASLAGYTEHATAEGGPVYLRYGMPSYAVWESGGIVYTLVGDIPYDVLDRVIAAFPHEPPPKVGALQRVGKGLAKMALWLTPMGALSIKLG